MADESIIIEVTDKVATTPADKFREIAKEAIEAATAIKSLTATLGAMPTASINRISSDLSKIASATARVQQAQEKAAASTDRNALAEQKLATELAKTTRAQALAEASQLRLNAQRERSASVQQKAAAAEESSLERLRRIAQAGIDEANARQKQAESYQRAASASDKLGESVRRTKAEEVAATRERLAAFAQKQRDIEAIDRENKARLEAAQIATRAARDKIAADKASQAATARMSQQAQQVSAELVKVGNNARLSRQQILTLQYTASDIVASLGSGISPLTIALQQGPQVAQSFTKEIGALASRVGIMGAAMGTAAFAVLGLGIAYNSAATESAKLNNALNITNNYAGLTEDSFVQLAESVADATNKSVASAREVAQALVSSGRFQRDEIERNSVSILKLAKITDQSAGDITAAFSQMADSPTAFAESLNKSYHFLSSAQLTQIRQLEEMGEKTKATELVSKALYDYLGTVDAKLGPLAAAWSVVSKAISNATTNLKEFVYGSGPAKQLAEVNAQLDKINKLNDIAKKSGAVKKETEELLAQKKTLEETIKVNEDKVKADSENLKVQAEGYEASKRISDEYLKTVDNVNAADEAVKKFRDSIKSALAANPQDKAALAAQAKAAEIEKKLREKAMPDSKAGDKVGETRALALAKVNAELDKQINGYALLRPERDIQQKLDQYELELASRKIKLSEAERKGIEDKLKTIQNFNAAQEASDRIYEEIQGPQRNYQASLTAIDSLLKQSVISEAQANQQRAKAASTYQDQVNPLAKVNRELEQQMNLLSLSQPNREIAQQMQQVENQLRQQGLSLIDRETGALNANGEALKRNLELVQKQTGVQQAYDAIYAQSAGAQQRIKDEVEALTLAYQAGIISSEQYGARMANLEVQAARLRLQMGQALDGDVMLASLGKVLAGYEGLTVGISDAFGDMFSNLTDGFSNAIAGAIMGTEDLGEALRNVAQSAVQQLIASLVKLGIQYAINAAIGQTLGAAGVAASIAMGASTAVAWAPAAAAVSLATLGANAAPASAGILSTNAVSMGAALAGFEKGGYTGDMGTKSIAGVVHGKEFVFDAPAVARIGVDNLEAMRSGRETMTTIGGGFNAPSTGAVGRGTVTVTVINNADGSKATTSQRDDENGNSDILVQIDSIENALASRVQSGSGPLHGSMRDSFDLQPRTINR